MTLDSWSDIARASFREVFLLLFYLIFLELFNRILFCELSSYCKHIFTKYHNWDYC